MIRNLCLVLLIFLQGCTDAELSSGIRGEAFKLGDSNEQKLFFAEMENRNIPFEMNERGFVVYLLKNQAQVHGILRKTRYGDTLKANIFEATLLPNKETRDRYEAGFRAAGIPYDISEYDGLVQINWSQTYGPQVDVLRQKLDEELMEYYIGKATNKSPQATQ